MIRIGDNIKAFLSILQAGLWEKDISLSSSGNIDFEEVYRVASEQSVEGLVAAGLEHVIDAKVPKEVLWSFVGTALQFEQRNKSMNGFIAELIEKMRKVGIHSILVKGQGIAQCYERPLWRASGDIDLLLFKENYSRASEFLLPLSINVEDEDKYSLHKAFMIKNWEVEIHGTLRTGLWKRLDKVIDDVQNDVFGGRKTRVWINGNTQIYIPRAEEDVFLVFTHILQHFFKGGIGLRQVCDLCRILYTFKGSLNELLLISSLKEAGVMSEWKAFGAFAVDYLGMPAEVFPLYSNAMKWKTKANRILTCIMNTGNFGCKVDNSFRKEKLFLAKKIFALWRYIRETFTHAQIFPMDSLKVFYSMFMSGMKTTLRI